MIMIAIIIITVQIKKYQNLILLIINDYYSNKNY